MMTAPPPAKTPAPPPAAPPAPPPVIVLDGDLDTFSLSKLRDALVVLAGPAMIDMTRIRTIDAATLGGLASLARQAGLGKLTLILPRGNLARLMKHVGFASLCPLIIDRRQGPTLGSRLARRRTD